MLVIAIFASWILVPVLQILFFHTKKKRKPAMQKTPLTEPMVVMPTGLVMPLSDYMNTPDFAMRQPPAQPERLIGFQSQNKLQ